MPILFAIVAGATATIGSAVSPSSCQPRVENLTVMLGSVSSTAEILRPPSGKPKAIMVLIHGSDVTDLDNTIIDENEQIVSRPLRDVANAMACSGVATIRYNKRFVSGPTTVDRPEFAKLGLNDFLADAVTALNTAKQRPDLRKVPELVFGWSEGSTVAAALAAKRPSIRGVMLQAPVISSFAKSLQAQYLRVGVPYMLRYATDGAVDADAIARASSGPSGVITKIYVKMFKGFAHDDRLNGLLDRNKDRKIEIVGEASPVITGWFADGPNGGLGIYATGVALPGVGAQLPSIKAPVLILQGGADGAMDDAEARSLIAANRLGLTVKLYPGLGHALGPSPSALEDQFLPTSDGVLRDMSDWIAGVLS